MGEEYGYFQKMVAKYETRNESLMKRLEELYARIEVMETTAPAVLMYNLFKQAESRPSMDLEEYISEIVPVGQGKAPISDMDLSILQSHMSAVVPSDTTLDSNDLLQLMRLENLMQVEKQMNERLDRMGEREEQVKNTISKIGRGELDDLQGTGTGTCVAASAPPAAGGSARKPGLITNLENALQDVEGCCSCKRLVSANLKHFVNKLIEAVRGCTTSPNKKAGFDPLIMSKSVPTPKCNCSDNLNVGQKPQISFAPSSKLQKSSASSWKPTASPMAIEIESAVTLSSDSSDASSVAAASIHMQNATSTLISMASTRDSEALDSSDLSLPKAPYVASVKEKNEYVFRTATELNENTLQPEMKIQFKTWMK